MVKKIFFIFLFIQGIAFAQSNKTPAEKAEELVQLVKTTIFSNPDTVLIIANSIIEIGIKNNSKEIIGRGYKYKGSSFNFKGNYDSAKFYALKAIEYFKESKSNIYLAQTYVDYSQILCANSNFKNALDTYLLAEKMILKDTSVFRKYRTLTVMYYQIADCYKYYSLYDKAIEYEFKSIEASKLQSKEKNNEDRYAIAGLAAIYYEQKQTKKAIEFHKKTIDICVTENDEVNLVAAYQNIAKLFAETKLFDSATYYNNLSIATYNKVFKDSNNPRYYYNQMLIEKAKSNYNAALLLNTKCLQLNQKAKDDEQIAQCKMIEGELLLDIKSYEKAKLSFLESLDYFNKQQSIYSLVYVYRNLINVELELKNIPMAEKYFKLYDSVSNLQTNKDKIIAATAQEIKYETALKEATIGQQQLEISFQKQHNNLLLGVALLLLLLAVTIYLLYNRQKQNAVNEKQKAQLYVMQLDKLYTELEIAQQQNTELQIQAENSNELNELSKIRVIENEKGEIEREIIQKTDDLFFKHDKGEVLYSNIYYFTMSKGYIVAWGNSIETSIGDVRGTFIEFEKRMPADFYRVHKSYIVNINHLKCKKKEKNGKIKLVFANDSEIYFTIPNEDIDNKVDWEQKNRNNN